MARLGTKSGCCCWDCGTKFTRPWIGQPAILGLSNGTDDSTISIWAASLLNDMLVPLPELHGENVSPSVSPVAGLWLLCCRPEYWSCWDGHAWPVSNLQSADSAFSVSLNRLALMGCCCFSWRAILVVSASSSDMADWIGKSTSPSVRRQPNLRAISCTTGLPQSFNSGSPNSQVW